MQDLDVIAANNAKAVEAHAIKTRDSGKWGVAHYTGLNFHSWSEHDTEADANAAAAEFNNKTPGSRSKVHSPIANA